MASDKVSKIIVIFLGQMFNLLLLFLLTPYLSRSLSKQEYGTFSQVQLLSTFFVALFSLGLSRIFYLIIEKKEFNPNDSFKTIMFLAILLGSAGSIASFVSAQLLASVFKNPDLLQPLRVYAPFFLINSLNVLLELDLIRRGLVRRDMTILILTNVVKLTLLLLSIQVWKSFIFAFWAIGLIAPSVQLILYLFNINFLNFAVGVIRRNILGFIFKIGVPLGVTSVLAASYGYLAGFFVSSQFTTSEFAIYRNGSIEIPFLGIISTSVASILTPQFATLLAEGQRSDVAKLKALSISEVSAITYPIIILVLFFAKDFLTLYLSSRYVDSTPIFFVYTLILFIRVNSYEDVLTGLGRSKVILRANIIYFLSNIILIFILIHALGILGAAIASVISIYILAILLLRSTAKYLDVSFLDLVDIRKIGRVVLYSIILCSSIKGIGGLVHNNWVKGVLIFAYFNIIYYILIRKKLLNIRLYEKLIIVVPFGKNIYKFLNK